MYIHYGNGRGFLQPGEFYTVSDGNNAKYLIVQVQVCDFFSVTIDQIYSKICELCNIYFSCQNKIAIFNLKKDTNLNVKF